MNTLPVPAASASPLRQRLIADMSMRRFSMETQRNYLRDVGRLASFLGRSPDTASAEDLRRFHIALQETGLGVPTMNAIVSALRFFFIQTIDRPDLARKLVRLRYPRSLPNVLSPDEVRRLLGATVCLKHLAALSVAYGAGLRASEVASHRRALDEQLDSEFPRAVRAKTDLSFLLIDVDSFKSFNDTYGHPAGDECLRRIGGALEGNLRRPGDFTARYGGEELAAVMPATSAAGAFERAEAVRQAVRELAIPHSGSSHGVVTISAGVATLTAGAGAELRDLAGLIQSADVALYQAKANGRDTVVAAAA
ncbi:diguanylate cyclase [Aurantimonas aggregata]|uniref:diguanylate cyclase n=1 Tax=Aurantimonas aggregata TaxID=2047720 RepID=A0A6L9MK21_9HYPH|nr:diguanylate cyclase [Aurantimonas aggregata]NDV87830.1 diguanylate cyclase [Aurantimonas aggregata]